MIAEPVVPMAPLDDLRVRRAELGYAISTVSSAISAPRDDGPEVWAETVHTALIALQRDFATHVQITEAPGAYHDSIIEAAPRLGGGVRRLTKDHVDIAEMLTSALEATSRVRDENAAAATEQQIRVFLVRLGRHRERGAELIYEAYGHDLGGGD